MSSVGRREPDQAKLEKIAYAGSNIIRQIPDVDLAAVEALHFRNSHPNSLKVFEGLLQTSGMREWFAFWARAIWKNGVVPLLAPFSRERGSCKASQEAEIDILFISHHFEDKHLSGDRDLYIGNLSQQLQGFGIISKTALIDHSPSRARSTPHHAVHSEKVLLPKTSDLRSEFGITARLVKASTKLLFHKGKVLEELALARYAARNAFSPASRSALRIGDQVHDLVKSLRPKAIFITYEGHSWERVVFRRAREADEAIKCFAYAHAPLFPMHHALAAKLGHGYDPDAIFVTGEAALQILNATCEATKVLEVLGSPRASARPLSTTPKTSCTCLILPEGLVEEAAALLDVALAAASQLPDVMFNIRMHPALNKERFTAQRSQFNALPANFRWSEGRTLDEDLAQARWAIYRGSSAIIAAPLHHTRPLYYQMPNEVSVIDPLFPLKGYRTVFRTSAELVAALTLSDTASPDDYQKAVRFCEAYYEPLAARSLVRMLAANIPTGAEKTDEDEARRH